MIDAAEAIGSIALRCVSVVLVLAFSACASGCGVVLGVGLALFVSDLNDSSSTSTPPAVESFALVEDVSPDTPEVSFRVTGGSGGALTARVDFVIRRGISDDTLPTTEPAAATALTGTNPFPVVAGETARFRWDAAASLGGQSAFVDLIIVPLENGSEGVKFTAQNVRAGNTPVQLDELRVSNNVDQIFVSFKITDKESDRVENDPDRVRAEFSVDGATFFPVALEPNNPAAFASSPEGVPGSFNLSASAVATAEALADIEKAGFRGELSVRLFMRDYLTEELTSVQGESFVFDNNQPPTAVLTPLVPAFPTSGVIPIRYRLFDRDKDSLNPLLPQSADLDVSFRLSGEDAFRRANEFPVAPSNGTSDLVTVGENDANSPDAKSGVFLWDALSQIRELPVVVDVAVTPSDREVGPSALLRFELGSFSGLLPVRDIEVGREPVGLARGDFDEDGFVDVVVANESRGSNSVVFLRGSPDGLLATKTVGVGRRPQFLASGDFDADGTLEVVVTNRESANVSYLQGGGSGLFPARRTDLAVGSFPTALETGDFDGDGTLDVVVASQQLRSGVITYLRGIAGKGLTKTGATIDVGVDPEDVASADFDGDGFLDVVVANFNNGTDGTVSYIRGTSEGPSAALKTDLAFEGGARALAVGDFDGDGVTDLVVSSFVGGAIEAGRVSYLRGLAGEGLSTTRRDIEVGVEPRTMITGDFNADSHIDLAVANWASGSVSFLAGLAGEGLSSDRVSEIFVGQQPRSLATGDFNGDGVFDLAVANGLSDDLSHLSGGVAGLRSAGTLNAGNGPAAVLSGDFDADGFTDVAVASENSDTVTYARGGGSGLTREAELDTFDEPVAIAAGDFDQDGLADVVVASDTISILTYFRGSVRGLELDFGARIDLSRRLTVLETGHFDGDEFVDLLALSRQGSLFIARGGPTGLSNERVTELGTGALPSALTSGDYDRDGDLDVVVANSNSNSLTYFRGTKAALVDTDEAGELIPPIAVEELPVALATGDYDGDGFVDVAVANRDAGSISYLRGGEQGLVVTDPKGNTTPSIRVGRCPSDLTSGDFDGDGYPDVVVANRGTEDVSYLRGGRGGLSSARLTHVSVGFSPVALASGDFDADGFPDVVAVGIVVEGAADVCGEVDAARDGKAIFLRGGPSGLSPAGEPEVGQSPVSLISGDFSGDGFLDAIVQNRGSGGVTFLRGGLEGPQRTGGAIATGSEPATAASGDFDGDGFNDVAVVNESSNSVTHLRQRFLTQHVNALLSPDQHGPQALLDPRVPVRYRLRLGTGAFSGMRQVLVTPGPAFDIAQREAFVRGVYRTIVTDPVVVQPEGIAVSGGATLTLRLRDEGSYAAILEEILREPTRLRVLRRNETGEGEELEFSLGRRSIIDLEGSMAVTFPIQRLGVYLVAFERDR